ncbi:MAG: hypothetical protein Q7R90_04065 [bacterium]|nr:hypothetical protein [bacterium]
MSTFTLQDHPAAKTLIDNLCETIGVRYTLFRKDKTRQYELMRADILCVKHGEDSDIWNFGRFSFQFEVSSSVTEVSRVKHDIHFATPSSVTAIEAILHIFQGWRSEETLDDHHAPAQPEWLQPEKPFVGILLVGKNDRSEPPASSSHWMLYNGLIAMKLAEHRRLLHASDEESRQEWLDEILWTTHERFGAFVAQNRNEVARRVFAG